MLLSQTVSNSNGFLAMSSKCIQHKMTLGEIVPWIFEYLVLFNRFTFKQNAPLPWEAYLIDWGKAG